MGRPLNTTEQKLVERKEYDKQYNIKNREEIRYKNIKRNYGLSKEEFCFLEQEQNGKCAICDKEETYIDFRTNKIKNLAIDHCHDTGQVRGLLCKKCNTAIGLLGDSSLIVKKALQYLEKWDST